MASILNGDNSKAEALAFRVAEFAVSNRYHSVTDMLETVSRSFPDNSNRSWQRFVCQFIFADAFGDAILVDVPEHIKFRDFLLSFFKQEHGNV